jgi:integrase
LPLAVRQADQRRTFLATVEDDRLYAAWWLRSTAGLRRGEVLGLRWQDLDGRRLAVARSLTQRGTELAFAKDKRG